MRVSLLALVAFSDGKPVSTFPENAPAEDPRFSNTSRGAARRIDGRPSTQNTRVDYVVRLRYG